MQRRSDRWLVVLFLFLGVGAHGKAVAGDLPTFDDFRRIDRTRRIMGQVQTKELMDVSNINSDLILATVHRNSNDVRVVWGAAELLAAWPAKRALFESALQATSNSVPIALRFACAAARQGEYDLAVKWAKYCEENDNDNTLPWLLELWVLGKRQLPKVISRTPPELASSFNDYSVEGSEARIRLLEKAGYSAYSARRLGFKADSDALLILHELIRPPIDDVTKGLLKDTASYLQQRRQFLLTELLGQTIERTLFALRPDADSSVEVRVRTEEIETRRDELKKLLGDVERNTVDYATEKQMVGYFDDVLTLGEEEAMKKLAEIVSRPAPETPPAPAETPGN